MKGAAHQTLVTKETHRRVAAESVNALWANLQHFAWPSCLHVAKLYITIDACSRFKFYCKLHMNVAPSVKV